MTTEPLLASGTDVGSAAAPAPTPAPILPVLPAQEEKRASFDEAALADAPTRTQPRCKRLRRRPRQAPTQRLLTFKDLPSDRRIADLGHKVRCQLEQALEQRRSFDRHKPRFDLNGIPDVELLWHLLYTGFDQLLGNPEVLVPKFSSIYHADLVGDSMENEAEYDYITYGGFYDTLLTALFSETDEQIVDKYARASLEISEERRAYAALQTADAEDWRYERDYGRAADDDDGGRDDFMADVVALAGPLGLC
jgi:hypothetical protein